MTTEKYDVVIEKGRVMDPESGLDAVRSVGIADGIVRTISEGSLQGQEAIDAAGLVVAPGFIDLHSHGQDRENYEIQAMDGVTTALELELGTGDVDAWYALREGNALVNFGASAGHIPVRMDVMSDPGDFLPVGDAASRASSDSEVEEVKRRIEAGLNRGALAVGFGLQYTPATSRWEVLEVFRIAARAGATCHVHMRGMGHREPMNSIEGLAELIAAAAITGASLHVVHINSSGLRAVPQLLQMMEEARANGVDVTSECYPYSAGMTGIESALLDEGWQEKLGIDYGDMEWAATGERLTARTFAEYRETGGMVILHAIPEPMVEAAVNSPDTMIATDGFLRSGKGHPRTAGTYSRVLGRFVREAGSLTLMDALRKMALMPAQRMESRTPAMGNKGRIRIGADADLVVFDPKRVADRSTYQEPAIPPVGIEHVLVNGVPVVSGGRLQSGIAPGRPVRSPAS